MNALLPKLAALIAGFVLAFTPGVCCGLVLVCRAANCGPAPQVCRHPDQAVGCRVKCCPARTACSDQPAKHRPCPSQGIPDRPCNSCCITNDATLPEKPIQQTDSPNPVLPVVTFSSSDCGTGSGGEAVSAFARAGPRLHVLLCVWRC